MSAFTERLAHGAQAMGLSLSPDRCEAFETYHAMLKEANTRMNLTRVPDDIEEAIDRNYLDCLTPLMLDLPAMKTCADVGSGAGFPGIPLAIALPETHFVLMDALGKRVDFLSSVIEALHLNAEAVHIRAEDAGHNALYREAFDCVCARAVAPMRVLSEYLLPLCRTGGCMMALKGPGADDELAEAGRAIRTLGGRLDRVEKAVIPGRDWDHRIVLISKTAATPKAYPRKAGTPEKKPL